MEFEPEEKRPVLCLQDDIANTISRLAILKNPHVGRVHHLQPLGAPKILHENARCEEKRPFRMSSL
ncbi:hypothetical protein DPMN_033871 [Dreissena polymorpha]|uniref:Uncharacterized protein n=1 Tax=Dreissena polymorpha TaxID=45954 RepID=A0A9D4M6U6_DREPO|nr:hypothetical protein DPMN_033871 [Dreissena polymorpha]